MARSNLPPGKKRYSLSLTQAKVEEFQAVARSIGMPPSIVSTICDEAIIRVLDVFKMAKEQGNVSLADLFNLIGDYMKELEQPRLIK